MNIFRLLGDLSHLASIFILIHKITTSRSARGISFKSQLVYLVVFLTRHVPAAPSPPSSVPNLTDPSRLQIFFISSSAYLLYLIKSKYRPSQDPAIDTFRLEYIIGPCAVLGLIFNYKFSVTEILWSFSIFLESVAILPQLFMLSRTGEAETITTHYLFALGAYRALYIPNWVYRYFTEDKIDLIAVIAGIVQTALYSDFFYIYYTKVLQGQKFELPA
ncbi:endoplasmic reticulum retention protein [Rhodotorula mucilaginosa]|uniref:ER lumen protein-retaining receptor n=1 Tax=Rhodotorula mucilaginosa TaxID=5537 RepID=A0A9P7B8M6_RHOMI|nr:endoplasmic reticulum retention protein [Rhodotorula mucilaginosa]